MYPISCGVLRRPAQSVVLAASAALLALPQAAGADEVRMHGRFIGAPALAPGTAFDLHFARENLAVDYADGSAGGDLRVRRLGLSFHEALSPSTRLGIRLGWAGLTQTGREATRGVDPTGYFAELDFAAQWPRRAPLALDLGASWRYTSVDETDDAGNRTELDWQSAELRPALRIGLGEAVGLRFGASVIAIDGDELRQGTASATTRFDAETNTGGFAAIDLAWADGDAITLRARGGNPAGVYVSFEQRY